jgi:hypothetical protein
VIDLTTIVQDLQGLTDADLEKVQLRVNGEVAVRVQNERLARRLEAALAEAQGVGFTDAEVSAIFDDSQVKVRKGRTDPDAKPVTDPGGRVKASSESTKLATSTPKDK